MASRPEPRLTYEDYVHFPEGERWELIDGVAYMAPSPNTRHQEIVRRLIVVVSDHLDRFGGGRVFVAPFDTVLTDADVVQPDVVFLATDDLDVLTEANIRGTPTWVVEVLSDPRRDRELKRQAYERTGVPEYWIVDPLEDRVDVFVLKDGRYGEPSVHEPPASVSPRALADLSVDLTLLLRH